MTKLACLLAVLVACGTDTPPPIEPVAKTTWYRDVGPIVANRCASCHQAGGIAPFALTAYEDASINSARMLHAVETNAMPPWDAEATAECTPTRGWRDDPRMTPAEVDTLRAWIADGTPAGDVAQLPAPPDTSLGGITHTVAPGTPYVTSGLADEFMCFVMQPQLANQVEWMTGLQVRPGNAEVVHHVVLNAMAPGAALDALVASTGVGKAFDCSSPMTTMDGAYFLGVWTPGMQPMETTNQISLPVIQGGAIVMQIHYHPAGRVNAPDATSIDLRLTSTWPQKMYEFEGVGNADGAPDLLPGPDDRGAPEFRVPARSANHRERMRFTADIGGSGRVPVFAAFPHMHYVGIELQVKVQRPSGTECLIEVPRWNFDWQRMYQYDAPLDQLPVLATGDIVEISCSWDNTIANPFVQRLLAESGLPQPVDLSLGEQTFNEMCLVGLAHVIDVPTDRRISPEELVAPLVGRRIVAR